MSKILLSSIGSRGDVQPILALAIELKAHGHDPTLCVAPDFESWVKSFGIRFVPVGPPVKGFAMRAPSGKRIKIPREKARQMVAMSLKDQFSVLQAAAKGASLIVVGGALFAAGRSVAEAMKIPYVYASYCACTLPSWDHSPPRIRAQSLPRFVNALLWRSSDRSFTRLFRDPLNEHRAALGLEPIEHVPRHIFTDRPWLAADATLSPAASTRSLQIFQTGAWFLRDSSSLPDALENYLANGEPPIYFGFGSMVRPGATAEMLVDAARQLKRRAVILQGWANFELADSAHDCIVVGDVNHEILFPRVAAIVHHGGAGTTTAAARGGKPQVIVPQSYDQYYFAHRVAQLGIGSSIKVMTGTSSGQLADALRATLNADTVARAQSLASRVEINGAAIAAQKLIKDFL
jgi:vancomycin aglycone glucosyltransferase